MYRSARNWEIDIIDHRSL